MILSFGHFFPAFIARAKCVTRRDWDPRYAQMWCKGRVFKAYSALPHHGGWCLGSGQLIADSRLEPVATMPDEDYVREGFDFMNARPHLASANARDVWGCWSQAAFERFRAAGVQLWVLDFEVLSLTSRAERWLADQPAFHEEYVA